MTIPLILIGNDERRRDYFPLIVETRVVFAGVLPLFLRQDALEPPFPVVSESLLAFISE